MKTQTDIWTAFLNPVLGYVGGWNYQSPTRSDLQPKPGHKQYAEYGNPGSAGQVYQGEKGGYGSGGGSGYFYQGGRALAFWRVWKTTDVWCLISWNKPKASWHPCWGENILCSKQKWLNNPSFVHAVPLIVTYYSRFWRDFANDAKNTWNISLLHQPDLLPGPVHDQYALSRAQPHRRSWSGQVFQGYWGPRQALWIVASGKCS